jgi:hypothetical protein
LHINLILLYLLSVNLDWIDSLSPLFLSSSLFKLLLLGTSHSFNFSTFDKNLLLVEFVEFVEFLHFHVYPPLWFLGWFSCIPPFVFAVIHFFNNFGLVWLYSFHLQGLIFSYESTTLLNYKRICIDGYITINHLVVLLLLQFKFL